MCLDFALDHSGFWRPGLPTSMAGLRLAAAHCCSVGGTRCGQLVRAHSYVSVEAFAM